MLSQKITFVNSELKAKIDPDANVVTIEPNDRIRGFGGGDGTSGSDSVCQAGFADGSALASRV